MNKLFVLFFLLFLTFPLVFAVNLDQESITLLSVFQEENGSSRGGTAEFTLQVQAGSGKIFLESYPAARIDMQVATRLANEYACEYSEVDCQQYDFFYTIRAGSPLIGGPSGGGAATVLTLAVLEDIPLREDVAMTGAITSGGILTPVSSVQEKIQAAQNAGYQTVIIPFLSLTTNSTLTDSNTSLNATTSSNSTLVSTGISEAQLSRFSVEVRPQLSVIEAFQVATGRPVRSTSSFTPPPDWYTETMRATSQYLCSRTTTLLSQLSEQSYNTSQYERAQEFINLSEVHAQSFYAKASYCFSANLPLQELYLEQFPQEVLVSNANRLEETTQTFREKIQTQTIRSFADLETYAIVTERLLDTEQTLSRLNLSNISTSRLAYALERYESAVAWSRFFGVDMQEVSFNENSLRNACFQELQSVETRMSYLRSILPEQFLASVTDELLPAYAYAEQEEFALCLFKATKAKAHANLFFTTLGLEETNVETVTLVKQQAAAQIIARQQPVFPLMGYSYLQYAGTFEDEDSSKLLFTEYAVVHSDVSGYFPARSASVFTRFFERPSDSFYFLSGLLIGMFLMFVLMQRKKP